MAALKRLKTLIDEVSAKSSLGKAVTCTLVHWPGLTAFLDDGRIEVDNNVVERSIKPACLARDNILVAGSTAAARHGRCWHHW